MTKTGTAPKQQFVLPVLAMVLCLVLAGCGTRPTEGALAINLDPAQGTTEHDVMIVTTRARAEAPDTYFSGERSTRGADFAEAKISVPPKHTPGNIEWPETIPGNPETDFVARKADYINGDAAFTARLDQRLMQLPKDKRTVFLFIHGYNTLFAEGLYRFTQFVHDAEFPGVPVLFTWASRGKLQDYVYDLNSAAIARDALETTIRQLAHSKAERIVILAHSMGNWLLLETVRQTPPNVRKRLAPKIENVILAAPDIDIDVFKSQLRRVGKLDKPFVVIVSRDDRALQVSQVIAGGKERVGAYSDDQELAELGAVVIDLTEVEGADSSNHSKFAQLAEFAPELRQVLAQRELVAESDRTGGALGSAGRDLGSFVTSTAQVAITLPIAIVTAPLTLATGNR